MFRFPLQETGREEKRIHNHREREETLRWVLLGSPVRT